MYGSLKEMKFHSINNSQSFKYKASLSGKTADAVNNTNSSTKDPKKVVPLTYLSNVWRSLEMPLINCKVYLELNWIEDELLNSSFEGVKRLFVLAYFVAAGNDPDQEAGIKDNKRYFLPRGEIKNYNVLIDGRNFYDQPINDLMKQYDQIRKSSTGYGDDYTAGCFLYYAYFKDNYRLIAVDLSKQKALDADPRAIQQIIFQGVVGGAAGTKIKIYNILEKSKETTLAFAKGIAKVF